MREVDKRTQFSRRGLLRAGATAVPAAALVGTTISATAAWAEEAKSLTPHAMATMVLVARDIYPHDHIADSFYIKAVTPWDAKAGKDPAVRDMIMSGVARLDQDAADKHKSNYLGLGLGSGPGGVAAQYRGDEVLQHGSGGLGGVFVQPAGDLAEIRLRGVVGGIWRLHQPRVRRHRLAADGLRGDASWQSSI